MNPQVDTFSDARETSIAHDAGKALGRFLGAWEQRNWRAMADACQKTWLGKHPDAPHVLEAWFGQYRLKSAKVVTAVPLSQVMIEAGIDLSARKMPGRQHVRRKLVARVICEAAAYVPMPAGKWDTPRHAPMGEGSWGVNPVSILRGLSTDA